MYKLAEVCIGPYYCISDMLKMYLVYIHEIALLNGNLEFKRPRSSPFTRGHSLILNKRHRY